MPNSTIILDHKKIEQIITRIAFQIYEDNCKEQKIIVAGIANKGLVFASLLVDKLKSISKIEVVPRFIITVTSEFREDICIGSSSHFS